MPLSPAAPRKIVLALHQPGLRGLFLEDAWIAPEERIRLHLAALEKAWQEVQDARAALEQAEERLRAGEEPVEADPRQQSGLSLPASPTGESPPLARPAAGGPLPPASPAVGGPLPSAPPAAGGPMGPRHGGGGRSVEYRERMESLESDVTAARARLDEALRRYNALR